MRGRRGGISVLVILSLPTLVLLVALAINAAMLMDTRITCQNSADGAAHAAACALVDDRMLTDDPRQLRRLLAEAAAVARCYVEANPVAGSEVPVELKPNPCNAHDGDTVFGTLCTPRDKNFQVASFAEKDWGYLKLVNTVRVTTQRTRERGTATVLIGGPWLSLSSADVRTSATATLDNFVIGLRPQGDRPIPLAPIALLSDPRGELDRCWERQVEWKQGKDRWRFDRQKKRWLAEADGIHEMEVKLGNVEQARAAGAGKALQDVNACLLQLGIGQMDELALQLLHGISREQLKAFGGELVLRRQDNRLVVPGTPWAPAATNELQIALQQLQSLGEARVWPLFSDFDPDSGMPVLSGFVAARVVQLTAPGNGGTLSFTLQPCKLATSTAVTDIAQQGVAGVSILNRYVCRVRLVE